MTNVRFDRALANVALGAMTPLACLAQQYTINTFAGGAAPPTSAPAVSVPLHPDAVAVDASGGVYFSSRYDNWVFRIDSAGVLTRVAGKSVLQGYTGDGSLATSASMATPAGLAVDAAGNLYIVDTGNHAIRKVAPNGIITTVAGTGSPGFGGDGGPAIHAQLGYPQGVAIDSAGNLFISEFGNQRIRKVAANGIISTVAGNGSYGYSGDGGQAINAQLGSPEGVAVDGAGNLWIADWGTNRIRKVAPTGIITTVAGTGVCGFSGDGGPAVAAQLCSPLGIAVDGAGNLLITDRDSDRIRKVADNGTITTVVGNGVSGFSGDGGPAGFAQLFTPSGVAVDAAGNIYIADSNNGRIRKVTTLNTIVTVAGNGATSFSGDGGPAVNAQLYGTGGIALDSIGNVFIADRGNNRIRKVAANGTISSVAGNGSVGYSGDGGPAVNAQLSCPESVFVDASNNLYIADNCNLRVRKVSADGTISTIAGNGNLSYSGDGGPATHAGLDPRDVVVDTAGNLFIADTNNSRIRKVSPSGIITTVAGNGAQAYSGDGGPATSAALNLPYGVALDQAGRLYIADTGNYRIRAVGSDGIITTVAGNGTIGTSVNDGAPAISASIAGMYGVAVDSDGTLYIPDGSHGRVRKVMNGIISSIAGTGYGNYTGDGGLGIFAGLGGLWRVALDSARNVYIYDTAGGVRLLVPQNTKPVLSVRLDHANHFTAGQTGSYSVVVSNCVNAAGYVLPTSGTVTVTELAPPGLTITGMSGSGWNCASGSCTRSDPLAGGAAYPPVAVTVNVSATAPPQVINQVSVSGGGSFPTADNDVTTILPAVPTLLAPANGATGIAFSPTLSWTSANGATSYEVYFGASSTPPLITHSAATAFAPGALSPNTAYYWRIAARNAGGTASSPVWSFTTFVEYQLSKSVSPAAGGSIFANPTSADGYYPGGTSVQLTATPAAGYQFTGWSGDLTGVTNPQSVVMNGTHDVIASFAACSYTLSAQSAPVGGGASSGSFNVIAASGCGWTASSGAAWITVTGGATSNGNGTVSYSVAANTGVLRTGTITAAGQTFTVTQAAFTTVAAVFRDTAGSIRLSPYASPSLSNSGGLFASEPSVAQDRNGNTFVTARDNYNSVWANVYSPATMTWSGWRFGGGVIQGGPSVAADTIGTAWIASRDTFNSYWLTNVTAGGGFGSWIYLTGIFSTDPVMTACGDGSVYIVGRDNWRSLWSGRYVPGSGFQGWQYGGGIIQGMPAVTCGTDNVVYVAVRDDWNSLWMARVQGNNWLGWSYGGGIMNGDPQVAAGAGTIYAVLRDAGGAVWYRGYTQGTPNGWQAWVMTGGVLQEVSPAVAGGELYLTGRSGNSELWWYRATGNQWTDIGNPGIAAGPLVAAPRW